MAEALGLVASVIAVIQLTNGVMNICYDYSAAASGASWGVSEVTAELESLRSVLQLLRTTCTRAEMAPHSPDSRLPALASFCGADGLLSKCLDDLKRLEHKLRTPKWCEGYGPRRTALVEALSWPFKKADTEKICERLGRYQTTFNLALSADQATILLEVKKLSSSLEQLSLEVRDGVYENQTIGIETQTIVRGIKNDVYQSKNTGFETRTIVVDIQSNVNDIRKNDDNDRKAVKSLQDTTNRYIGSEEGRRILQCLKVPHPSTNHNRAKLSRQEGTGLWFLGNPAFARWKVSHSLL
ncbi:hypothetical protein MMC25_001735 [Agyrium rufum]|nr:hypothetical protein [Agyrium rufum]